MKRFLIILLAGLLVAAFVGTSFAWEFSMKGEYEYRFQYFGRMGSWDIFGNAGNLAFPVGFAGPNIWAHNPFNTTIGTADTAVQAGWRITRGGFSRWGSDALINDQRLELNPVIRVNKAIRVFGRYNVGGLRNKWAPTTAVLGSTDTPIPLERYGVFQDSENAYDTMAIGSWEMLRSTFYTPWAIMSIGYKDFPLGTGASTGFSTRSTSWLMVVPYGPFRMMGAMWFARSSLLASYRTSPDGGDKPEQFWGFIVTYDNGDFDWGGGTIQRVHHADNGFVPGGLNQTLQFWTVYFKYNNGRFFSNAEYTWVTIDNRPAVNPIPGAIGLVRPNFIEGYHFFAESGWTMGPLKFTAVYALASGPVLNDGNPTKTYTPFAINYQAMEPYEWLMFNTYGGGNQEFNSVLMPSDGHGMMSDAYCYAARIDYAVACNLNVWGSYIWAHRLEPAGTFFGQYDINGNNATPAQREAALAAYSRQNPYIDDGFLGWEFNLGVDWKILEGMTFRSRYAWWQPGDYFGQAYQGFGTDSFIIEGLLINPAMFRPIDPIQAFEAKIVVDF